MNYREIVNNFYLENKSSECIIDKEFIIKKSKEFFYFGNWKNPKVVENELFFGLSNGLCFVDNRIVVIFSPQSSRSIWYSDLKESIIDNYYNNLEKIKRDWLGSDRLKIEDGLIKFFSNVQLYHQGGPGFHRMSISKNEMEILDKFIKYFTNELINEKEKEQQKLEQQKLEQEKILNEKKTDLLSSLDKDSDGELDLVDCDSFTKLLNKNQKNIIEIDKNFIQKFVKISIYLKSKKNNLQNVFCSINEINNDLDFNEVNNLLKNQVHTYELLVLHSISMITSLIESDLITFYEIYECFDQLGVFNSNWENEVSDKLTTIGDDIQDLMYSIYHMENKIVNSIENLTYITQDSFSDLNNSINTQLSSIDSSIKFNNLLTTIQTYQVYKINKNTKSLKE
jgi:hypothetical protein